MLNFDNFKSNFLKNDYKPGKRYNFDNVKDIVFNTEATNIEDQIKFGIKWYPSLYDGPEAREKYLSHLFLAVGGGVSWDKNGRKTTDYEDYTDEMMYNNRKERYEQDYRKKERENDIKSLKKDIEDYSKEEDDIFKKWVERDKKMLEELLKYNSEFDPHYMKYEPKNDLIDKIPWSVSIDKINNIPDNVQKDYLMAFYELILFYSQKRFKNDPNYKTILEMKKIIKERFKI